MRHELLDLQQLPGDEKRPKKTGVMKGYCAGCRPRGKNCAFMKKACDLLGEGRVQYCFECEDFPCTHLKHLDNRYRTKYHMSMIENLNLIKGEGMEQFLAREEAKWKCPKCGAVICCHNGLCYSCEVEELKTRKKKYQWVE
jgi:hypothetical protein